MFFALTTAQIAVFSALAAAVLALFPKRLVTIAKFSSCFFLFLSGLIAVYAGALALIGGKIFSWYFNPGFFGIIWHFKIDALAGFFLGITGLITACVAIYAPGYLRNCERKRSLTDILFFTALFVAGMYLVILANDAYSFMLAWELMSISSYFLVAYKHDESANSSAAFIYLLMAHASGLFILLGYSVLIKFSHEYTFAALANAHLAPTYATAAFLLALTGFSIKAGIMPLHVWLPRAHPVAPSHVSALMSGVMLKVAIYGLLRFTFSLLGNPTWQCGVIVLFLGTLATVLGVLYALMQHDLKKLLAYHSIENIGIIFIGIGLAMIFYATNHPIIAALGLIAALYHSLNHAIFKSLLFLGAGAIVEQSHEHDLEKMGGLIHKMPYTALFFLVGCISISVLPPFNGFVSEWLTFQTALQAPLLSSGILRTLIPVAAALLALAGALTAACFVKVYGVAFLGKARTKHVKHAKDPVFGMCFAMGILSLLCLVFGLFPTYLINALNNITQSLIGSTLSASTDWLWLTPILQSGTSYNAMFLCLGLLLLLALTSLPLLFCCKRKKNKEVKPWACGFGDLNSRMQYSATAFAMPIRRVFRGVWSVSENVDKNGAAPHYTLHVEDWTSRYFYDPIAKYSLPVARFIARIQGGNVRVYLAYVFFTLIFLLWVIA